MGDLQQKGGHGDAVVTSFPCSTRRAASGSITVGAGEKREVRGKAKQNKKTSCNMISGPSGGVRHPKADLFLQFPEDGLGALQRISFEVSSPGPALGNVCGLSHTDFYLGV